MQLLNASDCPALPVMDPVQDQLIGLLTAENVGEAIMVRAALQQRVAAINA
jgi:stage IV sporulation protein FB